MTEPFNMLNAEALVKQLLFFITAARKADSSRLCELDIQKLICHSISVLIDASVRYQNFWDVTKQNAHFEQLILSLLLEEKRQLIRRQVAEKIKTTCGSSATQKKSANADTGDMEKLVKPDSSTVLDIISTVWHAFVQNMQNTVQYADQSQEYFSAALSVFRSVAERSPQDVVFAQYISQWSESMLSHETEEVLQCCLF